MRTSSPSLHSHVYSMCPDPILPLHCRFDVLSVVCRYAPDLSERAAVHILLACAAIPKEDLVSRESSRYYIECERDHASCLLPHPALSAPVMPHHPPPHSTPPYSPFRPRTLPQEKLFLDKSGSIRYQHFKTEVNTAPTEEGKEGKPARVHKGPKGEVLTHGQLLSVMMEHIIRRRVSYSTVLLSDVMRKLITPAFSVILLRVVMLFLKGLCAPLLAPPDVDTLALTDKAEGRNRNGRSFGKRKRRVETPMRSLGVNNLVNVFKCVSSHTGGICRSYNDEHVQGAITWAEALLDSHFSSLAFRASFDGPTREALGHVMDTGECAACTVCRRAGQGRARLDWVIAISAYAPESPSAFPVLILFSTTAQLTLSRSLSLSSLTPSFPSVATASDASQEVERVLGLWVHVSRVIKSGGDHKSPSIALYQREKLRI